MDTETDERFECVYINPQSMFALAKQRGGNGCDLVLVLPEKVKSDCPRISHEEAVALIANMTNDTVPSSKPLFMAAIQGDMK